MVKVKIPLPEKITTNKAYAGTHWGVRKRWADLYHKTMLPYRGKIKVQNYPVTVSYIFSFKKKKLDASNCSIMVKLLEDSMVKNGMLLDDTPDFVNEIIIISQGGLRDEVEIIISEEI